MKHIYVGQRVVFKKGVPSKFLKEGKVYCVESFDANKGILYLLSYKDAYCISDFVDAVHYFNDGDKVMYSGIGTPEGPQSGKVYTIKAFSCNEKITYVRFVEVDGWWDILSCSKATPFTKKDLRPGMRVKYRKGEVRVCGTRAFLFPDASLSIPLSDFTDDLLCRVPSSTDVDVMEVYAAPDKCEDFFNMNVKGRTLYKREEKTEREKVRDAALEQIAELELRLAKLKSIVKE